MPLKMVFTSSERQRLGVLVNNISFYATQLISQTAPELTKRALANLAAVKKDEEALLKRLDEIAREQGEESPLRLVEDFTKLPSDAAQMLALMCRCLLAAAFLGHCLAQPDHGEMPGEPLADEERLH